MSEQLGVHADWELATRLALHEPRVGAIAAPLYRYRRWHGQATAGELALIDARLRTLDVIGRLPALTDQERSVVRAAWHEQYVASWRASRRGRGRDARSRAWTIARSSDYPFRVRSLAAVSVILPNQMQRLSDLRGRPRLRP